MHDGYEAPTGTDGKPILDGLFEHRFAAERSTIITRHRSFAATDTSRAGAQLGETFSGAVWGATRRGRRTARRPRITALPCARQRDGHR